jgi:hypothetical protein
MVRTGRVGVQLTDDHLVLHGAGAAKAPVRSTHFLDQTFLDVRRRAEAREVLALACEERVLRGELISTVTIARGMLPEFRKVAEILCFQQEFSCEVV